MVAQYATVDCLLVMNSINCCIQNWLIICAWKHKGAAHLVWPQLLQIRTCHDMQKVCECLIDLQAKSHLEVVKDVKP